MEPLSPRGAAQSQEQISCHTQGLKAFLTRQLANTVAFIPSEAHIISLTSCNRVRRVQVPAPTDHHDYEVQENFTPAMMSDGGLRGRSRSVLCQQQNAPRKKRPPKYILDPCLRELVAQYLPFERMGATPWQVHFKTRHSLERQCMRVQKDLPEPATPRKFIVIPPKAIISSPPTRQQEPP